MAQVFRYGISKAQAGAIGPSAGWHFFSRSLLAVKAEPRADLIRRLIEILFCKPPETQVGHWDDGSLFTVRADLTRTTALTQIVTKISSLMTCSRIGTGSGE